MAKFTIPGIFLVLAVIWLVIGILWAKAGRGGRLAVYGGGLALALAVGVLVAILAELPLVFYVVIPMFVAAIVEFGFIIALVARLLSGRVSSRSFLAGMLIIVGLILAGIVLMFQPFTPTIFNLGFDFVLIALILINVWSHVTPRPNKAPEAE